MACIHPVVINNQYTVKLFRAGKLPTCSIEVPCGKCLNCRISKQSSLIFLANKELLSVYKNNQGASFVTLTYDDSHIPINDKGNLTLRKKDLKNFMKRLRRRMEYYGDNRKFKYVYCGEYGDKFSRPHYHIAFLGLSDNDIRRYSKKVWKFGLCDVGCLANGGLRYVCKYMTKSNPSKRVQSVYEKAGVEKPFLYHSIGLGKEWILNHVDEIAKNNFCFKLNGKVGVFPKNICRYVSLRTGIDYRPIVKKFWNKQLFPYSFQNKCTIEEYSRYDAEVRYLNNVATMRSKGIPVDDELCRTVKKIKPLHYKDRKIEKLIDIALYGDVVPF